MSMSLYYTATKSEPFTDDERARLQEVCDSVNRDLVGNSEPLAFYRQERPEVLAGSSKPASDEEDMFSSLAHLLAGVSELRRAAPDAEWDVALDDIEVDWSEERGFELPGLEDMV